MRHPHTSDHYLLSWCPEAVESVKTLNERGNQLTYLKPEFNNSVFLFSL